MAEVPHAACRRARLDPILAGFELFGRAGGIALDQREEKALFS